MTKTAPLHVVVLDLTHSLDPDRLPREILARAPSTLASGHAGHLARVGLGPFAPRVTSLIACARSGASSLASCSRIAMVNDEVTPTWFSFPRSSYKPEQQRADETSFPVLCQRKPATTHSAVRACLTLIIARLPGSYVPVLRFGDHAVQARSLEAREPLRRHGPVARHRRQVDWRSDIRERLFEQDAAFGCRRVAQVPAADGDQVERDERRRRRLRQLGDA